MSRNMLLDSVDIFVEVVNAQSFSRAAARLEMPATTVSARIRRLEERLGATLLQRTTRRLSLTDTGERYFAHCVRAIELVQQAEQAVANSLEEPRGRLRITAPVDLCQTVLAPVIASYQARYPAVTIDLLVSNHNRDLVGEGIDLAVRMGELASSSLITRRFFTSAAGLWAAPDYLATHTKLTSLADLSQHRFIRMRTAPRGIVLRNGAEVIELESLPGHLQVDDMLTCQALAERGLGVALLPLFSQFNRLGDARLERILPEVQTESFPAQFLYPRQSQTPPAVRAFIELALEMKSSGALKLSDDENGSERA